MISMENVSPEEIGAAIKELRSQKDNPGSPAYFMYSMLATAHPTAIEFFEYQAAVALIAGKRAGTDVVEAFKTEEGREAIKRYMSEAKNQSGQSKEG